MPSSSTTVSGNDGPSVGTAVGVGLGEGAGERGGVGVGLAVGLGVGSVVAWEVGEGLEPPRPAQATASSSAAVANENPFHLDDLLEGAN